MFTMLRSQKIPMTSTMTTIRNWDTKWLVENLTIKKFSLILAGSIRLSHIHRSVSIPKIYLDVPL